MKTMWRQSENFGSKPLSLSIFSESYWLTYYQHSNFEQLTNGEHYQSHLLVFLWHLLNMRIWLIKFCKFVFPSWVPLNILIFVKPFSNGFLWILEIFTLCLLQLLTEVFVCSLGVFCFVLFYAINSNISVLVWYKDNIPNYCNLLLFLFNQGFMYTRIESNPL